MSTSSTAWRLRVELRPDGAPKPAAIVEHTFGLALAPLFSSPAIPVLTERAIGLLQAREKFSRALAPQLARMVTYALEQTTPEAVLPPDVRRTRLASGSVRRAVAALDVAASITVEAHHRAAYYNAAARLGRKLVSEPVEGSTTTFRMTRVA
jgi:hypothetical protein